MQRSARIIQGPWPLPASHEEAPLRLQSRDGRVLESFSDYDSAIRYRERQDLGPEWVLHDTRGEPTEVDRMMLLAMILRGHLMEPWRRKQFDRILSGESAQIPRVACDGLHDLSAAAAGLALELAGHEGWQSCHGHLRRQGGAFDHAWLEHEDGYILDFMADRHAPIPVTVIEPHEREACGYIESRTIFAPEDVEALLGDLPEKIEDALPAQRREAELSLS